AAAHFLFAALAALAGGALAFGIAQALSRRVRARRPGNVITSLARMRPIDPVSDLGSDSLDAPLERMPLGMANDEQAAGGVDKRVEEPRETREAGAPESNPAQGDGAEGHSMSIRRRLARALGAAEADRKAHDPAGAAEEDPPRAPGADERADDRKTVTDRTETDWTGTDWTDTDWTDTERPAGADDGVREMDLAEFGALPGRNGVWIDDPHTDGIAPKDIGREEIGLENAEEEGPATAPAPCDDPTRAERGTGSQAGARAGSPEGSGAIARLRERPADELSLVEMVERLAAALHDRQAADQARALAGSADRSGGNEADSGGAAGRDAALTEALKALGDLADGAAQPGRDAPAGPGNRDLAAALARLHDTRGAA
ncbi:MAG: hypothetical protein GVX90_00210, partial [Alphaproteobacteria bacterium]|nr:hypothetical protein [Alphaproteobacteria bacterium]